MVLETITGAKVGREPKIVEKNDVSNWWRIILLIIVIIVIIILWWIFTNPQASQHIGTLTTNHSCYMLLWTDCFLQGTPLQPPSGGRDRIPPFVDNKKHIIPQKVPKNKGTTKDIIRRPLVENWTAQKIKSIDTGTGVINSYTDNIANSQIINDKLYIRLLNERDGPTSAQLVSRLAFQGGFFSFRAKLPKGKGLWPSIWLLPFKNVAMNIVGRQRSTEEFNPYLQKEQLFKEKNPWPACGEIDIVETFGIDPYWYGTLFFGGTVNDQQKIFQAPPFPTNALIKLDWSQWHIFSLEWTVDYIAWHIDAEINHSGHISGGYLLAKVPVEDWFSLDKNGKRQLPPAPFNNPFHIILGLGAQSDWDGQEATMLVDWVKVYQQPQVNSH